MIPSLAKSRVVSPDAGENRTPAGRKLSSYLMAILSLIRLITGSRLHQRSVY